MTVTMAVLGGAGFLGTNFALKAIELGYRVCIYDIADRFKNLQFSGLAHSDRLSFVGIDLSKSECDLPEVVDVVVCLAALPHIEHSMHRPKLVVSNNVSSLVNVLEVVRRRGLPLIFTSSIEVYGGNGGEVFDERSPFRPQSPYAGSKVACEQILDSYASAFGLKASVVRLTNLYGPWQVPDRLAPRLITRFLMGLTCEVDNARLRNFIHVSDAVDAMLSIIEGDIWGGLFNIADGSGITTHDVARLLANLCGRTDALQIAIDRGPDGRGYSLVASGDRLNAATGWKPKGDLPTGLSDTIEWYRANKKWWQQFISFLQADRIDPKFIVDFGTWVEEAKAS